MPMPHRGFLSCSWARRSSHAGTGSSTRPAGLTKQRSMPDQFVEEHATMARSRGTQSKVDLSAFDQAGARVLDNPLVTEVEDSYLEYAFSVIHSRALPDARDGLKPVHRRILYGMYEAGLRPERAYNKGAQAVGR